MRSHAIAHPHAPYISAATGDVQSSMRLAADLAGRTARVGVDLLMLMAVILSLPFVILAIGIPIALAVQLLMWIGRLL